MTVKIGIIGAGGIARSHIRALASTDEARVVGVYDISEEAAAEAAAEAGEGAETFATTDALLDRNKIDAVMICVPQFARGDLEETAVARGIHLFVEKPLGLEMAEVRRKAARIEASGLINATGYCLRYYDTVEQARQYLEGKRVHLIQAHRFGTSHPSAWWLQLDRSGGHLVDAVTHQVDMIRYLAGEPIEVSARFGRAALDRIRPETTIPDAGALTFSMASGGVGSITESCVSSYHGGSEIKLFGADFFVQIVNNRTVTIIDDQQQVTRTSKVNEMDAQVLAFVRAVRTGKQELVRSNYAEGARTLAFTLAANRAAREGRAVTVAEEAER
ncbi:hypothetical protein B1748_32950 [Paenibacillus sp. MY03]|uniref:Gfo/Idh/MocA family protein n=1 Tax=Paenibacillus sp. MY03 TaxID=302980 RepID=UPI000B3BFA90|nr:Gfo/Idh/MocA family oxidoreductase [Paenibacillus sp. MY03]OUS68778.1 hypothetical protein B1748_32950 [Paenibacillus sp. MY03]